MAAYRSAELSQVAHTVPQKIADDRQIRPAVLMNEAVPEADRVVQTACEVFGDPPATVLADDPGAAGTSSAASREPTTGNELDMTSSISWLFLTHDCVHHRGAFSGGCPAAAVPVRGARAGPQPYER